MVQVHLRTLKDNIWLTGPQSVNNKAALRIFPLLALSVEKKLPLGNSGFEC